MIARDSSSTNASGVIAPYGGSLVDLMVPDDQKSQVRSKAKKTLECSDRNACDVELLVIGGFSPERGFMNQANYDSVVNNNFTISGYLFGLPIVLDTKMGSNNIFLISIFFVD